MRFVPSQSGDSDPIRIRIHDTALLNYHNKFMFRNPVCNNRSRFLLLTHKSRFVDFQKVRIQEVQAELPRGCIPRSLEVILRAESVEAAQAGDRSVSPTFIK